MKKTHRILLSILFAVAVWSGIHPYDGTLWFLEALPVVIGLLVLTFTFKRFQFTAFSYSFMLLHCCILLVGAHYSYAREPVFDWLRELFDWERNNYDKAGHFAQGFIPAIFIRELLIRLQIVGKKSWIAFITVSICLAISAFYELFEWFSAVAIKQSAEDFLGMQGYEWDTQSDMLCALTGAICAIVFFSKIQDKQIQKISIEEKNNK